MTTSYVLQNPSGYYFRIIIPIDLRPRFGLCEIRRSLKTGLYREAKERASIMAGRIRLLFRSLRSGAPTMQSLSKEKIQEIINQFFNETLQDIEDNLNYRSKPKSLETVRKEAEFCDELIWDTREQLATFNYRSIKPNVERLLEDNGLTIDEDSEQFRALCRGFLKAAMDILKIDKAWKLGDYSPEIPEQYRQKTPIRGSISEVSPQPIVVTEEPTEKLGRLIEIYAKENTTAGNWTPGTISEYTSCGKLVIRLLGDIPANMIGYPEARQFKEALMVLPKRFLSIKKHRGLTLKQIAELNTKDPISTSTVNKQIDYAKGLFHFAVRNGYTKVNPFTDLKVKVRTTANEGSAPFDDRDLGLIFNSKEYTEDTHIAPHFFWLPLLGLFTGARLAELASLHAEDVKKVDGVWVVDINVNGEGKHLKTKHSERIVPLHPVLVEDLGFPEFVQKVKATGEARLFHSLKPVQGKAGHQVSNWFTRFRDRIGITADVKGRRKSFHSFRDTFITHLKHRGTNETALKETVGHSVQDITMGRYGDKYPVQVIFDDVVSKLDYSVDLSHLKASKYCG